MGGTREENREPGAGSRGAPQFGRVFVGVSSMWSVSKAEKETALSLFSMFQNWIADWIAATTPCFKDAGVQTP